MQSNPLVSDCALYKKLYDRGAFFEIFFQIQFVHGDNSKSKVVLASVIRLIDLNKIKV